MHATKALEEADRLMTVCNACRYCEGLCAVFPAMEMRLSFSDGDLNYLANLCHGCGACYIDCPFSPPHEFDVNVPKTLARVRAESYAAYVWPRFLKGLFAHNALALGFAIVISVVVFVLALAVKGGPEGALLTTVNSSAFYDLMSHNMMAALFGAAFLYAIAVIAVGVRQFWCQIQAPPASLIAPRSLWQALKDAGGLRYLDGGGDGCINGDDRQPDRRRVSHHLTFYGFLLCFVATSLATLYHYLLGREAPYAWWDLPVVLGTAGGFGLVLGPIGLLVEKARRDPTLVDRQSLGMELAFTISLFSTGASGLLLLFLRGTPTMPILLAVHLAIVLSLFLAMPYGKFVHGIYRFVALVRYAQERPQ